jgi:hypothetical protein
VSSAIIPATGVCTRSATAPRGLALVAIYVALSALATSPLLWASVPPLVDYPNHLARMWVLTHGDGIAELAANYTIHWRVLPYMAMDVVVVALSWLMPVELAGRVFVAMTMLSLVGGTIALHRALHGRVGLWPLASLLFVYNAVLFWGFLSCLFTLGLSLFAFAGWIATRSWPMLPRIAAFSVVACVLLLSHLFAFGVYGLLVASYELGQLLPGRRLTVSRLAWAALPGLQFVPAVLLWRASLAQAGPTYTAYGDVGAKLIALLAPFNFGHLPQPFDLVMWLCGVAFVVAVVARRRLHVVAGMRVPLVVLFAAAILMPTWASGSLKADMRLPVVLPFVLIASTHLEIVRRQTRRLLALGAALLFGVRIASVSQSFADYDRWYWEFRKATSVIAPGARLLVVEALFSPEALKLPGVPQSIGGIQEILFLHMPALAVIERSAFFPYLFSGWTTVDVTPRNRPFSQLVGVPMTPAALIDSMDPQKLATMDKPINPIDERPFWRTWQADFDYVFWMSFESTPRPDLPNLEEVARGSYFSIYRIRR